MGLGTGSGGGRWGGAIGDIESMEDDKEDLNEATIQMSNHIAEGGNAANAPGVPNSAPTNQVSNKSSPHSSTATTNAVAISLLMAKDAAASKNNKEDSTATTAELHSFIKSLNKCKEVHEVSLSLHRGAQSNQGV